MPVNTQDVLCRYSYDPLDRLIVTTPASDDGIQRFYCKNRLATEIQGAAQRAIFKQDEQLLAQKIQQGDLVDTSLLATNQMRSVLQIVKANHPNPIAYSPYGYRPARGSLLSSLGFNGERPDPITGHYLLGNGYRVFNTILMRFNSPDNLSPFGMGGLNPYAYCLGDPINLNDESGHFAWLGGLVSGLGEINKKTVSLFARLSKPKPVKLYGVVKEIAKNPQDLLRMSESIQDYRGILPETLIASTSDLNAIPTNMEMRDRALKFGWNIKTYGPRPINFIYTDRKQLYIGVMGHEWLSALTASPKVISAGEISRIGDSFVITNSSGHFIPGFKSLEPVQKHLKKLGADAQMVRYGMFPD